MNFSGKSCKKCLISWESTRNNRFHQNLATFRENYHVWIDELYGKKLQKMPNFVKKHEKPSIWQKLSTFRKNYPVLAFSWTFEQGVAKIASFRGKAREFIDLAKTMQLFLTNYHVLVLRWTFQQKFAESGSICEKAREIIDMANSLPLFQQTTMSLHFDELFRKKLKKVPHFLKKHEKSSIWPNLWNFSNKLPCLCISINFSGKSCKKCLISWKGTGNHRSGQNFSTFQTNYHVFAFRWTFQKKVAKSASFREEKRETIDLARTGNFSSKLPCLGIFMNFSERSCKKCLISWESTRNNRFHQNLQLFEKTTMFGWTLWQKVAKSASFRGKARELIDLAKTMQLFVTNYHVLVFRWTVEQKVAKSCSIREKARKIIDLAKTLQLFAQTTMSLHFDELFRKKLQKVPHFVKRNEKPSIWPELATFRANYHVLAFSWTFQKEVAKSALFREKAREIIDFTKTCNFSRKLPCLDELYGKKLQKVPHSVEKHENSSIWPKLCNFL